MDLFKVDRRFLSRTRVALTALSAIAVLVVPVSAASATPATHSRSGVLAAAPTYSQAKTFDTQMIALVNNARISAKLPALVEAKGLTALSVWWSTQMQSGKTSYALKHNPNAWTMVTTYGASNRRTWGENVAWSSSTSTSAQQLFTAYMNSAGHRANILSKSYRYIGVGTVPGAHGMFNTVEFSDAVQSGQAVAQPPGTVRIVNGMFVRNFTTGVIYRIVGGAPVVVSSWVPFGKVQPTAAITAAQLASLPRYPANGTYVRSGPNGPVFRIAGGAPVYVTRWANVGGVRPTTVIDPAAILHAGIGGDWSHLSWYPTTPTYLQGIGGTAVYQVLNGTPTFLRSWSLVGGVKPVVLVDATAIRMHGKGGVYDHLR
jgi:uncharacterized protein YkwD